MKWDPVVAQLLQLLLDVFNCSSVRFSVSWCLPAIEAFNYPFKFRLWFVRNSVTGPQKMKPTPWGGGQTTPIFLHTSFRWVKIKFHAEIQLSKLPGIALNIWLEWWWSNSLLCHSQLELRLSWAMTNWGKDEGWKGRGEPCCCFLHISSS